MDIAQTRKWLEQKMRKQGTDSVTFGNVEVYKDMVTGELMLQKGQETYLLGTGPAEVFDELLAEISMYRNLGTDDPESDRTPEEQKIYDELSI